MLALGEPGGVGSSMGLIDHSVLGSLCSCLSSMVICHGDSICFPVNGVYFQFSHSGEGLLLTDGLSSVRGFLGRSGMVWMEGRCDDDATGDELSGCSWGGSISHVVY